MGKPTGFLEYARYERTARPVRTRLRDYGEVYEPVDETGAAREGARCMDCAIPFCHQGCPLGNRIPEWNDAVFRGAWDEAIERLHATNNFPEWTGHLCPAPCESSCVVALHDNPVNIKSVELAIVEHAFAAGWIKPRVPRRRTGRRVAVVGSGPAGLAAADLLNQMGHNVTVFERDDKPGGLLRYGIPDFKMRKTILDRRLGLLSREGITFLTGVDVGQDMTPEQLRRGHDAILLACGALAPRDMPIEGRQLRGVHHAMPYLTQQNLRIQAPHVEAEGPGGEVIDARDKHVIIIGGGDTGADCLGTAHRQGAASVHQLDIHVEPPTTRAPNEPWPAWPRILRVTAAHEEGGKRVYSALAERFEGNAEGHVTALHGVKVRVTGRGAQRALHRDPGETFTLKADLVLLALGFAGTEKATWLKSLGVRLTTRQTAWRDASCMTNQPGIFTAGDMQRGASLVVSAIADGREAAQAMGRYLATTR